MNKSWCRLDPSKEVGGISAWRVTPILGDEVLVFIGSSVGTELWDECLNVIATQCKEWQLHYSGLEIISDNANKFLRNTIPINIKDKMVSFARILCSKGKESKEMCMVDIVSTYEVSEGQNRTKSL